jgi:glycosyltransferase involved in cell wall biosynthesis
MREINIAVIVDQPKKIGGGFTHTISFCKDILTKNTNKNLNFKFYCFNEPTFINLEKQKIFSKIIKYSYFNIFINKIMMSSFKTTFFKLLGISHFEKVIINDKIDLVLFTHPSPDSMLLRKTNFIYTIWDMCHSDHPEFPEIRLNREHLSRENIYSLSCGTATAILVESETTKNIISERYNINRNKIFKINLYYNKFLNISENPSEKIKNVISIEYFFYPAQFWAHKNHRYIVDFLKLMKKNNNKSYKVVCSGANKINKNYIDKIIKENNLTEDFIVFNYLTNDEVIQLYKKSFGLIMPTYVARSTLPLYESFFFQKPVFYSNDILDKNLYQFVIGFDSHEPSDLINKLKSIENGKIDLHKITKSAFEYYKSTCSDEVFINNYKKMIVEYEYLRKRWEN